MKKSLEYTSQDITDYNRRTIYTKLAELTGELHTNLIDKSKEYSLLKVGNQELTEAELCIMAKQFFIKELSRQLTNLL